jgi:hypothetical protein
MTELSRHAVKLMAQAKSLAEEFAGQKFRLQIVDLTVYSEADMKKNIKARMQLSDGNSKITTMVPDKIFAACVSKFSANGRDLHPPSGMSSACK